MLESKETRWTSAVSEFCAVWAAGWALEHREQAVQGHSWPFLWHIWEQDAQLWALVLTLLKHAIPFSQLEQERDRSCAFATCIKCGGVSLGRERWGYVLEVTQADSEPCLIAKILCCCLAVSLEGKEQNKTCWCHHTLSFLWCDTDQGWTGFFSQRRETNLGEMHVESIWYPPVNGAYF